MTCYPLQTETQSGGRMMEKSRRWEELECADLWKWQDGREDVCRPSRVLCERHWVPRCPRRALDSHKESPGMGGNKRW